MSRKPSSNAGFSLVEIMVGLVIGLIAAIVMFEAMAVFERQKRATTGAADAQSNGAIAAYMMERDLKMAGWGMRLDLLSACDGIYTYSEARKKAIDDLATPGASLLASVIITDGGTAPDRLVIQYYQSPQRSNVNFNSTQLAKSLPAASNALSVRSTVGCGIGNLAVVSQDTQCMLLQVTGLGADNDLQYNSGLGPDANYNPPASYQTANNWPAFSCGTLGGVPPQDCPADSSSAATVQCFGGLFQRSYAINAAHELQVVESGPGMANAATTVSPDIVDLQARYGIADDMTSPRKITRWVAATGDWGANRLNAARIRQIKAVRLALLIRSSTYEKPDVQGVCQTTTPANMAGWPAWDGVAVFAAANLPPDYACYRFKVLSFDVPLRNTLWAKKS